MLYCFAMPLLVPLGLVILLLIYWIVKLLLLKMNRLNDSFSESFILRANKLVGLVAPLHLVISFVMLRNQSTLSENGNSSDNFEVSSKNKGSFDLESTVKEYQNAPAYLKVFAVYSAAAIGLYLVNLFLVNPVTCFFKEGCCFVRKNKPKKKVKRMTGIKYASSGGHSEKSGH
jgi:hypothetical protein